MSVTEASPRPRAQPTERTLSGWGRTAPSRARVLVPAGEDAVVDALAGARDGGLIARGAGCSYGDAAQLAGGTVLDMSRWRDVRFVDAERRLVRAQAGATIAQLMSALAEERMTLPVVPGTRHVTLAGAIASDIHGKNHHRDGGFARHVDSIRLSTPSKGTLEVDAESDPELFYATLGGMGLTGVILEATLRAEPLPSPWVCADVDRTDGLLQTLELLDGEERHRYSVAWLDLLAEGARMGRAVITRSDPMEAGPAAARAPRRGRAYPRSLGRGPLFDVPRRFPPGLLRPASVRAFNALNWAASRPERERPMGLAPYFFPLDGLGSWNRLYGRDGLIQYQYAIPAGAREAVVDSFELMRRRRLPVYLAVFKRFGPEFGGPLSFPLEGWTLAIDMPAGAPGVADTLSALDELVAGAGGRVYLTKDSRLHPDALAAMYPRLDSFHEQRRRVDADGILRSDLGRRLRLCDPA